jgi:4-hydroxybenzoate polyprenyltransferase
MQLPIAAALTMWLGGSASAYGAFALGIGLMTFYDLYGKRVPFPPFIDVLQGVGFAAMTLYGAAIVGNPTRLTLFAFLLIVVWMVLTNLIGGLRDLNTDLQFGAQTTPIFLGARAEGTRLHIPSRMALYAHSVLVILLGIELLALFYNDFGYAPATQAALIAAVGLVGVIALLLLQALFSAAIKGRSTVSPVMGLQLACSSLSVLLVFAPYVHISLLLVIAVIFLSSFGDFSPRPLLQYWRSRSLAA